MRIFKANISETGIRYFNKIENKQLIYVNDNLKFLCGINYFFNSQTEIDELFKTISSNKNIIREPERKEYGDFQTNNRLCDDVCNKLKQQNISPEIVIEPTCGKGNFIISSLKTFDGMKILYGLEIYKPYVWETKFSILKYFIENKITNIPEINIIHHNIFDFDFNTISAKHKNQKVLIIGNPPWVTNSKLSSLGSTNLPVKSNFKNHSGFDALTGKGNFDIGESILLQLLDVFSNFKGDFAFLVKNSVVKNILIEQNRRQFKITDIKQFDIDTKKEFNVSVNACLFSCKLGIEKQYTLNQFDFYSSSFIKEYGWVNDKFVSNVEFYKKTKQIDGESPFVWRQGLKHDASKIMELSFVNGHLENNKNEIVEIENDLLYGLLKSSDLKGNIINKVRKHTIVTQKKIGQQTDYIQKQYPKTYNYLMDNIDYFNNRKSSIYTGKPLFSIFGIGDYSFKPFKVAISGMYKSTTFSLVKPINNKPIMLDDTCYFIGFDNFVYAEITRILLNRELTQNFIQSISFNDSKRKITKDLLMRINLLEIIHQTSFEEIHQQNETIELQDWDSYIKSVKMKSPKKSPQLDMFSMEMPIPMASIQGVKYSTEHNKT
ncbi:MAG: hypothetical protein IIB45_05335 [Candidatus Marinimicrobia bacterium]|nr:hypothetical protein [Candidatus Neomarinimicrobiota bacterium]